MRITVTGATGLVGAALVRRLAERGDHVTVLTRSPGRASEALGVQAVAWDPMAGPAPVDGLSGRDAVVHLAGEPVAQRWSDATKRAIRDSRREGTANLVAGLRAADPRPATLLSASASGYYGPHGEEPVDESTAPGDDFLAQVCREWERRALDAQELGLRVALIRTGVVLSGDGGALATMLPPFRLGVGGPVAGGRQFVPWIHLDDIVGLYLAALDDDRYRGAINASAPKPATNRELSKALGRALHRPAVAPVPALALRMLYGEMAQIVVNGVNLVPRRATELGFAHLHPDLDEALRAALA